MTVTATYTKNLTDPTQDRIKFTPARSLARRRPDGDHGPGLEVEV